MENLAPNITRQRLLIEGYYNIVIDENQIRSYFEKITNYLELKTYGDAIIFSTGGKGKEANQGYDAFIPLIDSGISLYIWTKQRFLSLIIYTCKNFNEEKAIDFTKQFYETNKIVFQTF